jgi:hypothetical protein
MDHMSVWYEVPLEDSVTMWFMHMEMNHNIYAYKESGNSYMFHF